MACLLVIIYLAFISLGLPDSLLGSAWPSMYGGLGVSIDSARFGTGRVTLVSVAMTAVALLGFSFADSFFLLCVCAVPLGLGGGSVDAALNNFVALHYKAKHMNWLHCCWGAGASLGPAVMARSLVRLKSWSAGYRAISILQFVLMAILLVSLPLWGKVSTAAAGEGSANGKAPSIKKLLALPGAKQTLVAFFCYCGLEITVGLWGSTYLVVMRGIPAATAASWISLYFAGITFGRFLSGFLAIKLNDKQMTRLGQLFIAAGIAVLFLPLEGYLILTGLFMTDLGLAPIYPSLIHETPLTFGAQHSQSMIGLQMACAYTGTTYMPPLFGLLGANVSYGLFPAFLGVLLLPMVLMVVQFSNKTAAKKVKHEHV